jgi:hypothetical protein
MSTPATRTPRTPPVRLLDLDPRWIDFGGRVGLGVFYRCIVNHCGGYLVTLFANPLDKGPPFEGDSWKLLDELLAANYVGDGPDGLRHLVRGCGAFRWRRVEGKTFDTLTLHPSVNAHECGHLWLKDGRFGTEGVHYDPDRRAAARRGG